jgi:hypothetical protein
MIDLPALLGVDAGVVGATVAVTALAVDDRLLAGVCLAAHEAGELHVIKHVNAPVDCATMTQRLTPINDVNPCIAGGDVR